MAYHLSNVRRSVQEESSILLLKNGMILSLWSGLGQDPGAGGHYGVYGTTLTRDLTGIAPTDFRVPTLTEDIQRSPSATSFANGGTAIIFESRGPSAINGHDDAWFDTYIRFYNPDGSPRGAAKQLTPNGTKDHYATDVVTLANDQSVTLVARYEGAGHFDLLAYRHNAAGAQIGGPRLLVNDADVYVNSWTGAGYIAPSVAASPSGNYAVAWQERTQVAGLDGYAVHMQVFRPDGSAVAPSRNVGPLVPHAAKRFGLEQEAPEIATRGPAGYAVAWTGERADPHNDADIFLRGVDATGLPQMPVLRVNSDVTWGTQILHDVVDLGAMRTLVTYFHVVPDAFDPFDGMRLLGRVIGPGGGHLTPSFWMDSGIYYEAGGGNALINMAGQIVASFSTELRYADDQDVVGVVRSLTLPDVHLGPGNNNATGTKVNDRMFGQGGNDLLVSGLGNDLLDGGVGNDTLRGGMGADTLRGGPGADWLYGDLGPDLLIGGIGADVFVFNANTGIDVVQDFQNGADRLQFLGMTRAQVAQIIDNGREVGADAVLTLSAGSRVTLKNTDLDVIGLEDFLF